MVQNHQIGNLKYLDASVASKYSLDSPLKIQEPYSEWCTEASNFWFKMLEIVRCFISNLISDGSYVKSQKQPILPRR